MEDMKFKIKKYFGASLPILIPFLIIMVYTSYDIFWSIIGTIICDLVFILTLICYYVNKNAINQFR